MYLRHIKRLLGRGLERAAEALAVALLRAMRLIERPQAMGLPEQALNNPLHVLVIVAHPDDETLALGGTLARHIARGDHVTIAVITNGKASRAGGLSPEVMGQRRAEELRAAVNALGGATLLHLALDEGPWDNDLAAERLRDVAHRADLLYTHSPVDFHPDHARAARLTALLARPGQRILIVQTQTLLTPILINRRVPLSPAEADAKAAASALHLTQRGTVAAIQRQDRQIQRCYRQGPQEVFWEVTHDGFQGLLTAVPQAPDNPPFRGMRLRGFHDPLAVLAGTHLRWHFRRAVEAAHQHRS